MSNAGCYIFRNDTDLKVLVSTGKHIVWIYRSKDCYVLFGGLNIGTGRLLQVIGCNWYEATCGFLKVSCKE